MRLMRKIQYPVSSQKLICVKISLIKKLGLVLEANTRENMQDFYDNKEEAPLVEKKIKRMKLCEEVVNKKKGGTSKPSVVLPPPSQSLKLPSFFDIEICESPSFEDEGHVYLIPGTKSTEYNSSASQLLAVWKNWRGVPGELRNTLKALKDAKRKGNDENFANHYMHFSKTLIDYLNYLHHNPTVFLSFKERAEFLDSLQYGNPKNFYEFFSSEIYRAIERCQYGELLDLDAAEVLRFKRMVLHPEQLQNETLAGLLRGVYEPLTGKETKELFGSASKYGTGLHKYLELRQQGVCMEEAKVNLRDEEDLNQCEDFLAWLATQGYKSVQLERRLSIPSSRLCGSIDLLVELADGTYQISDYKRSFGLFNGSPPQEQFTRIKMGEINLSSKMVEYSIQMACYHKLLRSNGVQNLSPVSRLYIFHPRYTRWFCVELDLSEKMMPDTKQAPFFCGLGKEEYGEFAKTLSPLEVVELIHLELQREMSYHKF